MVLTIPLIHICIVCDSYPEGNASRLEPFGITAFCSVQDNSVILGKAMGLSGMAVALSSALVYDTKTVVLSVMGTYFSGIVLDHFIFGTTVKKRVCIISQKHDEILQFILHQLHSGATQYHAYGTYQETMRMEINTIVDKTEYMKLINFVTKTDPEAFVTIYNVNEMMYKPKPKS